MNQGRVPYCVWGAVAAAVLFDKQNVFATCRRGSSFNTFISLWRDKCILSSLTFNHLIIGKVALDVFLENLPHTNHVCVSLLQMLFQKWELKPNWPGRMWLINDIYSQRLSQEVGSLTDASVLTIKIHAENQDRQWALRKHLKYFWVSLVQELKSQLSSKKLFTLIENWSNYIQYISTIRRYQC